MARVRNGSIRRVLSVLVATCLIGSLAGCSMGRVWGRGGKTGAIAGTLAGISGSLAADPQSGTDRTGIVIGSTFGGAILGGIIGHYFFDKKVPPAKAPTRTPGAR